MALAPLDPEYTHGGYFVFLFPDSVEPIFIQYRGNVPLDIDVNNDGIPDALQVSQSFTGNSEGIYDDQLGGSDSFTAKWTRPANSKTGTCKLNFPVLGLTFSHAFEVLEYDGGFTYSRNGSAIQGTVEMTRAPDGTRKVTGPLNLAMTSADLLTSQNGSWNDSDAATLPYTVDGDVQRDRTLYVGGLLFDDGDPSTPVPDFHEWLVVIEDTRDANQNGVPDFTDSAAPPAPPSLALKLANDALTLSIDGTPGVTYILEESPSLTNPAWAPAGTYAMANTSQTFTMTKPALTRFYRLRQQ